MSWFSSARKEKVIQVREGFHQVYNYQGLAIWNVAGAQVVWQFAKPIAITFLKADTNTLGIRFPDVFSQKMDFAGPFGFPLLSSTTVVAGFTALRANDPAQIATSRQWTYGIVDFGPHPIVTRTMEFLSFGASGSVNWMMNFYFPDEFFKS